MLEVYCGEFLGSASEAEGKEAGSDLGRSGLRSTARRALKLGWPRRAVLSWGDGPRALTPHIDRSWDVGLGLG